MAETNGTSTNGTSPPVFREALVYRNTLVMTETWQRWLSAFWQQAASGTPGPEGPQGPVGPPGPQGPAGPALGAGAANKVGYWLNAGAMTYDSLLHYDPAQHWLGIGTATPAYALDVTGHARLSANLGTSGYAPGGTYGIETHSVHSYALSRFEGSIVVGGGLDVYTASMMQSLRLGDHAAPGAVLDVNGTALFRSSATFTTAPVTANLGVYRPNGAGDNAYALYSELNAAGGVTRYAVRCVGDAPNYMVGALGIGAPTDGSANAKALLVYDKSAVRGLVIRQTTDTGNVPIGFQALAGTFAGYIQTDATTTQYVTSSDARLKEQVEPLPDALATILRLEPVRFRWKVNDSVGHGLLAQAVQAVVPGVVSGAEDGETPLGIDYGKLVPWLLGAVHELAARVDALEGA